MLHFLSSAIYLPLDVKVLINIRYPFFSPRKPSLLFYPCSGQVSEFKLTLSLPGVNSDLLSIFFLPLHWNSVCNWHFGKTMSIRIQHFCESHLSPNAFLHTSWWTYVLGKPILTIKSTCLYPRDNSSESWGFGWDPAESPTQPLRFGSPMLVQYWHSNAVPCTRWFDVATQEKEWPENGTTNSSCHSGVSNETDKVWASW